MFFSQSEKEKDVVSAISACSKLFCTLLERKELFKGKLPEDEESLNDGKERPRRL